MRNVIQQTVSFEVPSAILFEMYLDPVRHAAFTGSPVTISRKSGSEFRAFEGALTGSMLVVVEPRLIVQSWRSLHFHEEDRDSTLILAFPAAGESGRIDLVHLDVPDHDLTGVTEGWEKHYWTPWRAYLEGQT